MSPIRFLHKQRVPRLTRGDGWYAGLTLLLVAGIGAAILWPFITFQQVLLYTDIGSDTLIQFYPRLVHAARYLREEGLPGWSFHHGLGEEVYPAGLKNPFNWVLYWLGPDRLAWGLGWVEWGKLVLAGAFFSAYLRCLNFSPWVRVIGTLLLTFSGYFLLGTTWWGHSYKLVVVALLLWAIERYLASGRWMLVPIAVALLSGPDYYFFGVFFLVYLSLRFLERHDDPGTALRQATGLAVLALVGVLISSAWFLPSAAHIAQSPRVAGDAGLTDALRAQPSFGLASATEYWTATYRAFSNDLIGAGSAFRGWGNYLEAPAFYVGLLALLMFPQALLAIGRRKWIYLAFLSLWTLPVVFPWFRYALSLFAGDYYKTGLSFFWSFAAAYLALRGLDALIQQHKGSIGLLIATAAALLAVLHWPNPGLAPDPNLRVLLTVMLILLTAVLTLAWRSTKPRRWMPLLLALVVVEVALLGHITVNNRDAVSAEAFARDGLSAPDTRAALAFIRARDDGFYRVHKSYTSAPTAHGSLNDALVEGYYSSPSYSSFNNANYIGFLSALEVIDPRDEEQTRWSPGVAANPVLQGLVAGKYFLFRGTADPHTERLLDQTYEKLARFGDVTVYRNRAFIPFGVAYTFFARRETFDQLPPTWKYWVVLQAAVLQAAEADNIEGMDELSAPARPAGIVWDDYLAWSTSLASGPALDVSYFSANRIVASIAVDQPVIVFLPMSFDAGWRAELNGGRTDLTMLHGGLTGLMVPAGSHQIVLRYRPPLLFVGLAGSVVGLMLYLGLALRPWTLTKLAAASVRHPSLRRGDVGQATSDRRPA